MLHFESCVTPFGVNPSFPVVNIWFLDDTPKTAICFCIHFVSAFGEDIFLCKSSCDECWPKDDFG